MGKIQVAATLENLEDLFKADAATIAAADVRRVEVPNALVDTGAMMLSLPKRLVNQLGLKPYRARRVRTVSGIVETSICSAVRLTVQGREFTCDVAEIPDDCPVLIGQIALEGLDMVIDPIGQRLLGNPEHGGEHMIDILQAGFAGDPRFARAP
jgi:clan AA aspartic protease